MPLASTDYVLAASGLPSGGDTSEWKQVSSLADGVFQTAIAALTSLTDNSGGAAANDTIGAVTAPTALTHGVGTADNTVDDVGGAFNQTTLNNNFKELTTAQAANRLAIVALTDAVKELSTKINAIIGAAS